MYNDYIKEKISEKLSYDINFIKEYLLIYFNFLILFIKEEDKRKQLSMFVKDYLKYSKKEYELLLIIKKLKNEELADKCVDILEELEDIFIKYHETIDMIMGGYEEAIFYKDISSCLFRQPKFDTLSLENNIKVLKKG